MPFNIIRNDITKVKADAIVNTANPEPGYGSGTDCAIYKAAGEERLLEERRRIGKIAVGEVAVTKAFDLDARYIIHAVGPVWIDGEHREYEQLASCYKKSLLIARAMGCESIAFPLIAAGNYGFPKDKALAIALETIGEFLAESDMDVTLVVFDSKAFALSSNLLSDVQAFIDEKYAIEKDEEEHYGYPNDAYRRRMEMQRIEAYRRNAYRSDEMSAPMPDYAMPSAGAPPKEKKRKGLFGSRRKDSSKADEKPKAQPREPGYNANSASGMSYGQAARPNGGGNPFAPKESLREEKQLSLDEALSHMSETFQERLLRMIDERGLTDTVVYKRANLDRKLFSKIRTNRDYTPKKKTAIALAVALELNKDQTLDLLRRAGLTLSPSSKADLIVEYCLDRHIYNIYEINALLFEYDQPILGS